MGTLASAHLKLFFELLDGVASSNMSRVEWMGQLVATGIGPAYCLSLVRQSRGECRVDPGCHMDFICYSQGLSKDERGLRAHESNYLTLLMGKLRFREGKELLQESIVWAIMRNSHFKPVFLFFAVNFFVLEGITGI